MPDRAGLRTSLEGSAVRWMVVFAFVGIVGLAAAGVLGHLRGDGWRYLSHSYLISFCFFASISLGGLFFVAVQHATRAGWSVTVRRLAEITGANMPVLGLLMLPVLLPVLAGSDVLYPWVNPKTVAADELLEHKSDWLNPQFFALRSVAYLVVWVLLGRFFLVRSLRQDASQDTAPTLAMERLSPAALILFALTISFASFDWLMSLMPTWYSTIYGVYYFGGSAVAIFAWLILAAMALQARGRVQGVINVEHYHDLGKFLFAFVIFWGYIAFSQYLLIWYANIPEETQWYLPRQQGQWTFVSLGLIVGHMFIPFLALLSRHVKRSKPLLAFWAVWLMAMHWIDLYWLVMPGLSPEVAPFSVIDVCCFVGIGGVWMAGWLQLAGDRPLVPLGDPRLHEALAFENV